MRFHPTLRARPVDRFAQERDRLRPLPEALRGLPRPYAHVHTTNNSRDPRFVGRRVELRVFGSEVRAVALDAVRRPLPGMSRPQARIRCDLA